ncbi:MAG TPA: right-handed parallel beta-helix repeat-containing protein [Kiritimatiellia bacterium]|jgi:hypothetical protein|nr:right-handed parallel beta-helix repeat-containing protein [Kiritimatiellia bacterium]HOR98027.1 right-handed parallel beta-helix repeat-containing protein [Kiritimatiellia bacterium]HPK37832.1 right-handed parallel beta-helix repeat-containing protein [Kiritimatiellia bacterium]HRU20188.1 right-handed parallel beta-helix repeat-containing protein [Kiritimatiellia bacterium]
MKTSRLITAGWLVFACVSAWAQVPKLYVKTAADGGNDVTGDGSWDAPYATIQRAMDVAVKEQKNVLTTISVQPGVYPGSNYVNSTSYFVDVRAQKRVNGVDVDNDNPRETVIDGSINRQFGFDLRGWKMSDDGTLYRQSVCGFTVTNGLWTYYWRGYELTTSHMGGGGVTVYNGAMASNMIVCCCITEPDDRIPPGKTQGNQHGAVQINGNNSLFTHSFVYNCTNHNTAASLTGEITGGGVYMYGGTIRDCTVSNCWLIADKDVNGNRRGGGIYLAENQNGLVDRCVVVDCGTSGTRSCEGGGICNMKPNVVTNSFIANCTANGNGGGICCSYGGNVYDCTVSNCINTAGYGGNFGATSGSEQWLGTFRGCRFINCSGTSVYLGFGIMDGCLIENNTGTPLQMTGKNTILRNSVIRNNTGKKAAFAHTTGADGTGTVERCWFVDNDCGNNPVALRGQTYARWLILRDTLIAGNTCKRGVSITAKTSWSDVTDPWVRVENCTVAGNTCSDVGIGVNAGSGGTSYPDEITITNCLVTANNGKQAFNDYLKVNGTVGNIAYCAADEGKGTHLPDGCHNVTGTITFREGTFIPTGSSVATERGFALPRMREAGASDMGDGTFTIMKSGEWGVKIVPNNVKSRIIGVAPEIGACEYMPSGTTVMVN